MEMEERPAVEVVVLSSDFGDSIARPSSPSVTSPSIGHADPPLSVSSGEADSDGEEGGILSSSVSYTPRSPLTHFNGQPASSLPLECAQPIGLDERWRFSPSHHVGNVVDMIPDYFSFRFTITVRYSFIGSLPPKLLSMLLLLLLMIWTFLGSNTIFPYKLELILKSLERLMHPFLHS